MQRTRDALPPHADDLLERDDLAHRDSAPYHARPRAANVTGRLYDAEVPLAGARCGLTLQVQDVEATYRDLTARGLAFEHAPQKLFWGYGAEVRDPDGYLLMLWDVTSMREKGGT